MNNWGNSNYKEKVCCSRGLLSANMLKILAMFLMVLDHSWATVIPGNNWMTYLGRLAFPLFAFLVAEGFFHTGNVKKYALRLLIFALISEIPFNLMTSFSPVYPFHQNVMWTLLAGLLIISHIDRCRREISPKRVLITVLSVMGLLLLSVIGFVDYGFWGVITIVMFYVAHEIPHGWILQLAGIIFINVYALKGLEIMVSFGGISFLFPTQGFAVFALILIWLYNGRKGRSSKALQYGFYAFYPVHMLVLVLIALFI